MPAPQVMGIYPPDSVSVCPSFHSFPSPEIKKAFEAYSESCLCLSRR